MLPWELLQGLQAIPDILVSSMSPVILARRFYQAVSNILATGFCKAAGRNVIRRPVKHGRGCRQQIAYDCSAPGRYERWVEPLAVILDSLLGLSMIILMNLVDFCVRGGG